MRDPPYFRFFKQDTPDRRGTGTGRTERRCKFFEILPAGSKGTQDFPISLWRLGGERLTTAARLAYLVTMPPAVKEWHRRRAGSTPAAPARFIDKLNTKSYEKYSIPEERDFRPVASGQLAHQP